MKTPVAYLASVASARGLFIWLFEDAQAMLPPPTQTGSFDLVSLASLQDAAKGMGCTKATVRRDLTRLVNFGWVQITQREPGGPKRLGRRVGMEHHLLADLAAETVTGQQGVISKLALRLGAQAPAGEASATAGGAVGTGTRRVYEGSEGTWSWGGVRHGEATKDSRAAGGPGRAADDVDRRV